MTDIADCLGIDASEVGPYLTSLFSTMGAASRTDAILRASRRGLLAPDA